MLNTCKNPLQTSYHIDAKGRVMPRPRVSANGAPTSTIENVEAFSIERNTIMCMVSSFLSFA